VGSLCLFHDRIVFIRDNPDRPIGFQVAFSHVDLGDYCGLKVEDIWLDPGEDQIMNSIQWESLSVPSWTLLNVLLPKYGILIAPHRLLTEPLQHDYWDVRKKLWSIWELRYVPNRGLIDLNQDRRILTFKGLDLAKLEDHIRRPMTHSLESITGWENHEVRPSSMFSTVYIDPAILGAETTEVMDEHPQDLICDPIISEPNEDISK
jgi:hypothetical protein